MERILPIFGLDGNDLISVSLAELAAQYQVHPNQVSQWKKQLLSQAQDIFSGKNSDSVKTADELTAPLFEEIGRLKMDIKWLEKSFEPA